MNQRWDTGVARTFALGLFAASACAGFVGLAVVTACRSSSAPGAAALHEADAKEGARGARAQSGSPAEAPVASEPAGNLPAAPAKAHAAADKGAAFGGGGLGFMGPGPGNGVAAGKPCAGPGCLDDRTATLRSTDAAGAKPAPAPVGALQPGLLPIDPNGRFATTYRPGGGHLAAFESAVARGIIPASEREVVSDVGARYAPPMDPPKGKALALRMDLERGKLPPNGGPFHLRIALRSTADRPSERPHLSVHLVLDISGSMQGESITRARDAAGALVDKLAPTDDFSMVTFSTDANVVVPDGLVGARREAIKKTIAGINATGGTNIGLGLQLGYAQASAKAIPEDAVRVVLLLSDGRANVGITAADKLSQLALDAFQRGIQTSSFGLGADYDGPLMSSIAAEGAGGYYYLRDAEQISPALATEIDKRLDPVATAVELRVRLKKDVSLLRIYGSRRLTGEEAARVRVQEVAADNQAAKRDKIAKDRQDDTEGGMRFFFPAFAPDDSHALLLQLAAPPGTGEKAIALVELKYKDRGSKKNIADEIPLKVIFGDSDSASGATIDASVARTIQGFAAGETLREAALRVGNGDRATAVQALAEREAILRTAAETLKEPLFLKDADRLAHLRSLAGGDTGVGDPVVLSLLLETASRTHLH